jgi:RND family efflux transporter MFP subunit
MARWRTLGRILVFGVTPAAAALVVLLLVILYLAGAFTTNIAPEHREVAMQRLAGQTTDEVHLVTKEYVVEAVGKLRAANRSVVSSKILATIEQITVRAGDEVKPGQLLVSLGDDEFQARLQQAEQALSGQLVNRSEAKAAFDRAEQLRRSRSGTISQGEYDQVAARYRMAEADVRRYEQALQEAKVQLSYAQITAPEAGRIVKRLAEPGDTAAPGQPLLEMYDPGSLSLEAPVPETLAVKLAPGDPLTVRIDSRNLQLEGTVDEIVPQADVLSRSVLVKVAVPESKNLYEGLSGRLLIPAGTRKHLCLAERAIRRIGQLEFVDVVRDDKTLERRLIKTGRVGTPGRLEVLSGLAPGEQVVLHEHTAASEEQGSETPG